MALPIDKITGFSRLEQDSAVLHRPMMLKDFLRDASSDSCRSAPSPATGFPMYLRESTTVVSSKSNKPPIVLLRSWSKKAAATKMSAIHKVINVVKLLQFTSLKSPSVLPRSFSRKLSRRSKDKNDVFGDVSEVKVKVKDILRWRSFRDMAEDSSTPLDFPSSPNRSTATATTTTATTSSSCSKRSSWCDSDFTAEELPPWGGENVELRGKNAATFRTCSKGKIEWESEEYEQQSPVSVLDSPFTTSIHGFAGAKCSVTRRTQEHNNQGGIVVSAAEQKARQLLSNCQVEDDQVMLDFLMHELAINGKLHDDGDVEFGSKSLRIAESWINGEFDESYDWEVEEKRESYIKDMEKETCWNKFKQEQEEVAKQLEIEVLNDLIDHLLADFPVIVK